MLSFPILLARSILSSLFTPSYRAMQTLHTPNGRSLTVLILTDRMKEGCCELIDNGQLNYQRYCQNPR